MGDRQVKIAVTAEAAAALADMAAKVNDGFKGGHVGQRDLASWLIMHFAKTSYAGCVEEIRASHFDRLAYLAAVVKELRAAERSGAAASDIDARLDELTGTANRPRAKARRAVACASDTGETAPAAEELPS